MQPRKRMQYLKITHDLNGSFFSECKISALRSNPWSLRPRVKEQHQQTFLFLSLDTKASFVSCLGGKCRAVCGPNTNHLLSRFGLASSPFAEKIFANTFIGIFTSEVGETRGGGF